DCVSPAASRRSASSRCLPRQFFVPILQCARIEQRSKQRKAGSISESRRQEETGQICRHGPRPHRRKFSDVLPNSALNGLKGSAASSLEAALSPKSAPSPTCLHSSRFIPGLGTTRTFLRDTRAHARRKQTNSSRNALRLLTLPHKRIATWLG